MEKRRAWQRIPRFKTYQFVGLAAVEFLMSFTFLGYIHVEPISITVAYLPILLAGCFLGVWQAAAMGLFFGLASMYKASAYYVMPTDMIFSPFLSGFPLGSLLLSIGTRALFGWLVGVLFQLGRRTRHPRACAGVISLLAPKLHSVLVYSAMGLCFPALGYDFTSALHVAANDAFLALLCLVVVEAAWSLEGREELRHFGAYLDQGGGLEQQARELHWAWLVFLGCILGAAIASTFYFAQRMSYMLGVHGLELSPEVNHDLLHLQLQSLFATAALVFFLAVCLLLVYKYFSYRAYVGQLDAVTGTMGRKMFSRYCEQWLEAKDSARARGGWFLLLDVDYFKGINDALGHPAGDLVLKKVAQALLDIFSPLGSAGRMGGDEFAMLLTSPVPEAELRQLLERFQEETAAILPAPEKVTCSIGGCRFTPSLDMQALYAQTDRLLYAAKRQGRACYVLGSVGQAAAEDEGDSI